MIFPGRISINGKQMASFFFIFAFNLPSLAQQTAVNANESAFKSTVNINTPTTTIAGRHGFEFHIRHRFGVMNADETIIKDFLGTDLTANIQFGFAIPVTERLMLGVGRTKTNKEYDINSKYLVLRQDTSRWPVSVAVYFQASAKSADVPEPSPAMFYEDSITPFKNKFNHRLSYNTQLIISRKFGKSVSLQISPAFIYRNLVPAGQDNYSMAFPLSGAVRTSKTGAVIFEAAYLWNYEPANNLYPISIGYEIGTTGHVFQVVFSTSAALLEYDLYTTDPVNYDDGEFLIGFNIKRTFWHRKKIQRMAEKNLGL